MKKEKNITDDAKLRQLAEKALDAAPAGQDDLSGMSPKDMAGLIHELRVHQIELKMQNEELRRIQGELEKARDRYSHLYDFAPVGYFSLSEKGIIEEVNLTGAAMVGIERSALIGKPFSRFVQRDDQDIFYKHRQRLLETETSQSCELRLVKNDGHEFHARLECVVIKNKGEEFRLIRAAISDITERKQIEEALQKSSEKIKLFAYSISHDLKSPANGLYGLTKRLHKDYADILDEKGQRYCERILKTAGQIAELVEQINVFISTKELSLNIERLAPKEVLQVIREEFSSQLNLREIRWSEPDDIPEIEADRLCLIRALRNLVDNALKYGGDALSEIDIKYKGSGEFHILSVKDNGTVPTKQDSQQDIFAPFVRGKTSKGIQGSGLGLTILKEIAEKHGGEVWFEHGHERGVTFYISILKNIQL
jgi:PAS domain S-box-containing protein